MGEKEGFARTIAHFDFKYLPVNSITVYFLSCCSLIATGLTQLKSFIYQGAFRSDEAVLASAKAAYLAAMTFTGYEGEIQRWQDGDDILMYMIKPIEYQFLNKRRNIPGGAFFYWYQTLGLLGHI